MVLRISGTNMAAPQEGGVEMNTLADYCKGEVAEIKTNARESKSDTVCFILYSEIEQGAKWDSCAFPDRISFPFESSDESCNELKSLCRCLSFCHRV